MRREGGSGCGSKAVCVCVWQGANEPLTNLVL